jgi:hypothetical protein
MRKSSTVSRKPAAPRFHVGDQVRVLHGFRGAIGEVVEDRGNLGAHGERIYAVRMRMDAWNEVTTEFPEDSLESAATEDDRANP